MEALDRRRSLNDLEFVSPRISTPPRRLSMSGGKWQQLDVDSDDEVGGDGIEEVSEEHNEEQSRGNPVITSEQEPPERKSSLSMLFNLPHPSSDGVEYETEFGDGFTDTHTVPSSSQAKDILDANIRFDHEVSGKSSISTLPRSAQRKDSMLSDDGTILPQEIVFSDFFDCPFTSGVEMKKCSSNMWGYSSNRLVWIDIEDLKLCWSDVDNQEHNGSIAPKNFTLRVNLLAVELVSNSLISFTVGKRAGHLISSPISDKGQIEKIYKFETISTETSGSTTTDLFRLIMTLSDDYVRIRSSGNQL